MKVLRRVQWSPFVLRDGRIYDVSDVRVLDGAAFDYLPGVLRVCEAEVNERHSDCDARDFQIRLYPSALEKWKFDENDETMCRQIADWTRGWVWRYLNAHAAPPCLAHCHKPIVVDWR